MCLCVCVYFCSFHVAFLFFFFFSFELFLAFLYSFFFFCILIFFSSFLFYCFFFSYLNIFFAHQEEVLAVVVAFLGIVDLCRDEHCQHNLALPLAATAAECDISVDG